MRVSEYIELGKLGGLTHRTSVHHAASHETGILKTKGNVGPLRFFVG